MMVLVQQREVCSVQVLRMQQGRCRGAAMGQAGDALVREKGWGRGGLPMRVPVQQGEGGFIIHKSQRVHVFTGALMGFQVWLEEEVREGKNKYYFSFTRGPEQGRPCWAVRLWFGAGIGSRPRATASDQRTTQALRMHACSAGNLANHQHAQAQQVKA